MYKQHACQQAPTYCFALLPPYTTTCRSPFLPPTPIHLLPVDNAHVLLLLFPEGLVLLGEGGAAGLEGSAQDLRGGDNGTRFPESRKWPVRRLGNVRSSPSTQQAPTHLSQGLPLLLGERVPLRQLSIQSHLLLPQQLQGRTHLPAEPCLGLSPGTVLT